VPASLCASWRAAVGGRDAQSGEKVGQFLGKPPRVKRLAYFFFFLAAFFFAFFAIVPPEGCGLCLGGNRELLQPVA
jgi:hypothetical protein